MPSSSAWPEPRWGFRSATLREGEVTRDPIPRSPRRLRGRLRRPEGFTPDDTRQVVRSVYILPNLFTTFNLFFGILAIHYAIKALVRAPEVGQPVALSPYFTAAALCLLAAIFFDGMDGLVAVLTHATSKFGMQYDSLADMVSFGVAPAVVLYAMFYPDIRKIEVAVLALFSVCTALRLARYNVQAVSVERGEFLGLPSPAPAGTLAGVILFLHSYGIAVDVAASAVRVVFMAGALLLALLMVSNVRYLNPKRPSFARARRNFYVLVGLLFFAPIAWQMREAILLVAFLLYIVHGLARHYLWPSRARRSASAEAPAQEEAGSPEA